MSTPPLIFLALYLVGWTLLVNDVRANPLAATGPEPPGRQGGAAELLVLPRVFVNRFRFAGKTILPEAELRRLVAPYENRTITYQELEDLRQTLSSHYLRQGYINSGVLVNDQTVTDGVVTFTIIEGTLTAITIHDNRYFRTSYLRNRIGRDAVSPLNVHALQQNLQLLQQDPRIKQIKAELRPGIGVGEGILDVTVDESPPLSAGVTFDNGKSPSIGDLHGELFLSRQNLLGLGDSLEASYGLTDGEGAEYALAGSVPVNVRDTLLTIHASRTETGLVEEPFKALEIQNQSKVWGLSLSHPFWREPAREFRVGLAWDLKENKTFLLGRRYPLFEGTDNGRNSLSIGRFTQEYVGRGAGRVMALSASINGGDNRSIPDDQGLTADKRFYWWQGQGKLVSNRHLLGREVQAVLRSDIQLSASDLLPSERFSMGGMNSVRGYRENSFMKDNGLFSSLELRIPLGESARDGDLTVRVVPFVDAATGWNKQAATRERNAIASTGIGLLLTKKNWLEARLFYGVPLEARQSSGDSLQDRGVHFRMTVSR